MSPEPIGLVIILIGLVCLSQRVELTLYVLFASSILMSSAAFILTALGSSSIPPAQVMLGIVLLAIMRERRLGGLLFAIRPFLPGFWLALLVAYGVVSAIFLPRIFEGATFVFAVARVEGEVGIFLTPLRPVGGNITQSIYMMGSLVCFLAVWSLARSPDIFQATLRAAVLTGGLNVAFACLDLLTHYTGTEHLLQFFRNANYTMLNEAEVSGLKRIVGSYPEASAYASYAIGHFAFCTRLFMVGIYPRVTGMIALLTLASLAFSTSSTGYAGLGILATTLYGLAVYEVCTGRAARNTALIVVLAPIVLLLLCLALLLEETTWTLIVDMIDRSLFTKLETGSAIERASWNTQALINAMETLGLGGGLGSVRASSFLAAVPANVGLPGTLFYAAFLWCVLCPPRAVVPASATAQAQGAARAACFALLVVGSLAASSIDLGLQFYIFAAIACTPVATASLRPGRWATAGVSRSTAARPGEAPQLDSGSWVNSATGRV